MRLHQQVFCALHVILHFDARLLFLFDHSFMIARVRPGSSSYLAIFFASLEGTTFNDRLRIILVLVALLVHVFHEKLGVDLWDVVLRTRDETPVRVALHCCPL